MPFFKVNISKNKNRLATPTQENDQTLLPTPQIIKLSKEGGVDFGSGNPGERIRYFIKLGLLPYASRKVSKGSQNPIGHLPYWTVARLIEIDSLNKTGLSFPQIAEKLKKESPDKTDIDSKNAEPIGNSHESGQLKHIVVTQAQENVASKSDLERQIRSHEARVEKIIDEKLAKQAGIFQVTDDTHSLKSRLAKGSLIAAMIFSLISGGIFIGYQVLRHKDSSILGNQNLSQNTRPVNGQVLAASTERHRFYIDANTEVTGTTLFQENITAPNIIYGVTGGTGISVTGGQNPIVSLDSANLVTSVNNLTGGLTLAASGNTSVSQSGSTITISSSSSSEADTLATVTGRGATTSTALTFGSTLGVTGATTLSANVIIGGGTADTATGTGDLFISDDLEFDGRLIIGASAGSNGQCLLSSGSATAPTWGSCGAGGGMTSFTLSGDNVGGDQTISDSNTLEITGGAGLTTTAGATDTLTITVGDGDGIAVAADSIAFSCTEVEGTDIDCSANDITLESTINSVTTLTSASSLTLNSTSADLALTTTTSGNITATTASGTGIFNILTGNLRVGTGTTPDVTLNGEDAYIEGTLEVDGGITGSLTGNVTGNASTATALAANGTNCSAGSGALGVDASGNAESCTDFEEDLANSAGLAAALSDETGSGFAVFATSPQLTTSLTTDSTTFALINTTATTVNFAGAATTLNIGPTGATATTIDIAGGSGATGCTVAGATGNLTCSGNITSGATGTPTVGYWTRNTTSGYLYPATLTDNVGIGISSPTAQLHVVGGQDKGIILTSGNGCNNGSNPGDDGCAGADINITTGNGGTGGSGALGGSGGTINILGGTGALGGGAGDGSGGSITVTGGNGTGVGSGGNVTINGGSGATTGTISVGTSNTSAITIGNNTSTTALNFTSGTGAQKFTSSVISGTGITSAFVFQDSALTTGTGVYGNFSGITSGKAVNITSASTAGTASDSDYLLYLDRSGANANTAHNAYGVYSTVANTNVTSGTNIAGYFTASGATTANYGLWVNAGTIHTPLTGSSVVKTDASGNLTTGTVTVAQGGTGLTTFGGAYTLLYTSATDTLTSLANGSTGQCLTATTSSAPSWGSCAGTGVIGGSGTDKQIAFFNGTSSITSESSGFGWDYTNKLFTLTSTTATGDAQAIVANSLSSGSGLSITSTGTAATSNTQTGLNIALSGTNGTSTQTTYGLRASNTHAGTASTNIAGLFTATGGTTDIGVQIAAMTGATSTGIDIGAFTGATTNTGINITSFATGTTSKGIVIGTNSSATAYGLDIGALSGTTTDVGIKIGAISGAGAIGTGINIGAITSTGAANYGIFTGNVSGATNNYGIVSSATTNAANYALYTTAGNITNILTSTDQLYLNGTNNTTTTGVLNILDTNATDLHKTVNIATTNTMTFGNAYGIYNNWASTATTTADTEVIGIYNNVSKTAGTDTGSQARNFWASYNTATFTGGALTSANVRTYGGFFGATGDTAGLGSNTYGIFAKASGADNNYGIYSEAISSATDVNYGLFIGALSGATSSKGIQVGALSSATSTGIDIGAFTGGTTNTGINITSFATGTTSKGIVIGTNSSATAYGLDIGALSGATTNVGAKIGAISGAGTGTGIDIGAFTNTGASQYGINIGAFSGTHNGGTTAAINVGAISSAGTTTNNYGLLLGTLTGGTTANAQIQTGILTGIAGANNYGINLGAVSTAGANNYGIYIGSVTGGATTNYALYAAAGNVNIQGLTASQIVLTDANKNLVSGTATAANTCSDCLIQVPLTTARNTITPTAASVVALTVNGTSSTAATALAIVQTGEAASQTITASNTTTDVSSITASSLTTGTALTLTGPASTGVTDHFVKITTDVGSASSAFNINPDFSGAAVTGYGIYQAGTDATTSANKDYGIYNTLTLTGNAAKVGIGVYNNITNATNTSASTLYGEYNLVSDTGANTTGTKNTYGGYFNTTATGTNTTALNTYGFGVYGVSTATQAHASGISYAYGGYFNATGSTTGTGNAYGIYGTASGGDNNYGLYADGNIILNGNIQAQPVNNMLVVTAVGTLSGFCSFGSAGCVDFDSRSTITSTDAFDTFGTSHAASFKSALTFNTGVAWPRAYGLLVQNATVSSGSLTNQYGVFVADLTSATNDYGVYVAGADTYGVYIGGGDTYALLVDANDAIFDANVVVGGSTSRTETMSNAGFSLGGDDLFVAGMAGVEGSVYTDTSFIVGATTTLSDGTLVQSGTSFDLLNTVSTTINFGGAATTALNIGNGTGAYTAINLGSGNGGNALNIATGTGADTINIGTGATNADTINIGTGAVANTIAIGSSSATTVSITDNNWSITAAGAATFVSLSSGSGSITTTGTIQANDFDRSTAGALTFGNTNATSVSICNSAACDTITIGTNADPDTITIGDAANDTTTLNGSTVAIDSGDWDISTTGDLSGIGTISTDGDITISNTTPSVLLTDTTASAEDYSINADGDAFTIRNETDGRNDITVSGAGAVTIAGIADGTDALILTLGDILVSNGDLDLSGGDFNVTLDAADSANITNSSTNTANVATLNLSQTNTATTGNTSYGLVNAWTSSAVVTGTAQNAYGEYNTVTKTGADSSTAASTFYGSYNAVSDSGANNVASTRKGFAGVFNATVTDAGASSTSTAYGIYATATGADNNYAGIFASGLVGIGISAPTAQLHVVGATTKGIILTAGTDSAVTATGGNGVAGAGYGVNLYGGSAAAYSVTAGGNIILTSGTGSQSVINNGTAGAGGSLNLTAGTGGSGDNGTGGDTGGDAGNGGNISINPGPAGTPGTGIDSGATGTPGNIYIGNTNIPPSITIAAGAQGIAITSAADSSFNASSITANSLVTGAGLKISSTSIVGGLSGSSYLLKLDRSGANANAHTAYGVYSAVTNTGTSSNNVAGYFSASGADTANYALYAAAGTAYIAGSADGTDALILNTGDILVSNGDLDLSGGDFNVALDAGDSASISKGAASGATAALTVANTTTTSDTAGSLGQTIALTVSQYADDNAADTHIGLDLLVTNNATDAGTDDIVYGFRLQDLAGTTGQSNNEYGLYQAGTGWDYGIVAEDAVSFGSTLDITGTLTANGAVNLGDATSDDVTITGYVASAIIPKTTEAYDLGTDALRWNDLYIGGQTLHIGATSDEATLSYATGTNTLLLDNVATGTINIGTTALAQTITLGNNTTSTSLALISGTGDITLTSTDDIFLNPTDDATTTLAAAGNFKIDASSTASTATAVGAVDIDVTSATDNNRGIDFAYTSTYTGTADQYGIYGNFDHSAASSGDVNQRYYGIYQTVTKSGADGATTGSNYFTYGIAINASNSSTNSSNMARLTTAGYFSSTGTTNGNTNSVYGLIAAATGGKINTGLTTTAITTAGTANYGIFAGNVSGATNNYGIVASATTNTANYALYTTSGNIKNILGATDELIIDGSTTPSTATSGVIDFDVTSLTHQNSGLNLSYTSTAAGADTTVTQYGTFSNFLNSQVFTATSPTVNLYGNYNNIAKSGSDVITTGGTFNTYGTYNLASNTSTDVDATRSTFGGYFKAAGDPSGTTTAYGIYTEASGGDNNYGIYALNAASTTALYVDAFTTDSTLGSQNTGVVDINVESATAGNTALSITHTNTSTTSGAYQYGIYNNVNNSTNTNNGAFLFGTYNIVSDSAQHTVLGTVFSKLYGNYNLVNNTTTSLLGISQSTYASFNSASSTITGGSTDTTTVGVYGNATVVDSAGSSISYGVMASASGADTNVGVMSNIAGGAGDYAIQGISDAAVSNSINVSIFGQAYTSDGAGHTIVDNIGVYGYAADLDGSVDTKAYGVYGLAELFDDNSEPTGRSAYGGYFQAFFNENAGDPLTGSVVGVSAKATITDNTNSGTPNLYSLIAGNNTGAGGVSANSYGVYVSSPSTGIVNNYGVYVANQTGGSTVDYGIYLAGADNSLIYGAITSATTGIKGVDLNYTSTNTGTAAQYGVYASYTNATAFTTNGITNSSYGSYFANSKTGADTATTHTVNVYGTAGIGSITQSSGAGTGTRNIYGGYFAATGDTEGTETTYGVYSTASGSDETNYAAYFASGSVRVPLTGQPNGIIYADTNGILAQTATGGAGTLCLVSTAGGTPTFSSCAGSTSTSWSALSAPSGNLSLAMAANTTAFTFNTVTTADAWTMSSTSLTTGTLLTLTGSTSVGITDHFTKLTSDIGSGSSLLNLNPDFSGAGVTAYGIYQAATDATTSANTNYGIYNLITLTNNAAKTTYGETTTITSTSTTAESIYGLDVLVDQNAATASGNKTLYGQRTRVQNDGITDAAGTHNIYGAYFDAIGNAGGTSVAVGVYIDNISGADTNYGLCFDCDGTYTANTVASGIQFGTDANGVNLYRSAADSLSTADGFDAAQFTDNNGFGVDGTNALCKGSVYTGLIQDCSGTPADYAEMYGTADGIEPGDVVSLNPNKALSTQKSTVPYDSMLFGIVSTMPNDPIGRDIKTEDNPKPIALAGRVPVKISLENGPVLIGDRLTSSSTPGVAMKAIDGGPTLGIALENYDGSIQLSVGVKSVHDSMRFKAPAETPNGYTEEQKQAARAAYEAEHPIPQDPPAGIGKIMVYANIDTAAYTQTTLAQAVQQQQSNPKNAINYEVADAQLNNLTVDEFGVLVESGQLDGQLLTAEQVQRLVEYEVDKKVSDLVASGSLQNPGTQNINSPVPDNESSSSAEATDSARLAQQTQNSLDTLNQLLTTTNLQLDTLTVNSTTNLAQTQVAGTFSQDGTFIIDYGKQLNVLGSTLFIQNDPYAGDQDTNILVDIGNGKVTIDKNGSIKLAGTLTADKVNTKELTIDVTDENAKSAGTGTITSGRNQTTIFTTLVKPSAKILITPTTPTGGKQLYVANKAEFEGFTVALDGQATTGTIQFDWLIVNTTQVSQN